MLFLATRDGNFVPNAARRIPLRAPRLRGLAGLGQDFMDELPLDTSSYQDSTPLDPTAYGGAPITDPTPADYAASGFVAPVFEPSDFSLTPTDSSYGGAPMIGPMPLVDVGVLPLTPSEASAQLEPQAPLSQTPSIWASILKTASGLITPGAPAGGQGVTFGGSSVNLSTATQPKPGTTAVPGAAIPAGYALNAQGQLVPATGVMAWFSEPSALGVSNGVILAGGGVVVLLLLSMRGKGKK